MIRENVFEEEIVPVQEATESLAVIEADLGVVLPTIAKSIVIT